MTRRSEGAKPPGSTTGLTLVELMIALALGAILVAVVATIWTQTSRIYTGTLERLEIYKGMRVALDVVERDLANSSRTVNMEFWNDANGNGRYDPGEELAKLRDPYDPLDPVFQNTPREEFAGFDASSVPYFAAPVMFSPSPYEREKQAFWRDEVYVRSFVMVQGANRSALVHYRLCNADKARPSLRRRVIYLDANGQIDRKSAQPTDETTLVTDGVVGLKFGFFFKPSPINGAGRWYHVRPDGPLPNEDSTIQALVDADQDPSNQSARPADGFRFLPARSRSLAASGDVKIASAIQDQFAGQNALSFFYEGWGKFENLQNLGVRFRTIKDRIADTPPTSYPWRGDEFSNFDFPGIRQGDQVQVFDAQDDDQDHADDTVRKALFPDQTLTVNDVISESPGVVGGAGKISVRFSEAIDFFRLRPWLQGEADDKGEPIVCDGTQNAYGLPGLKRTINGSFNARYRVGFLPSAFLVRLSYLDRRTKRVVPVERVIRLLNE